MRTNEKSVIVDFVHVAHVGGSCFLSADCDHFAGSLEAAYSLNWGAREIWGKGGGETLALYDK